MTVMVWWYTTGKHKINETWTKSH